MSGFNKRFKGDEWFGQEKNIRKTKVEENPPGRQVRGPRLLQGHGFTRDEGLSLRSARTPM